MKKILVILFSIIIFSCCGENNSNKNINPEFTYHEKIDNSTEFYHYQYDINWNNDDVDIRLIKIKDHEYIVTTSYVGRAGGVSTIHAESCDCKNR